MAGAASDRAARRQKGAVHSADAQSRGGRTRAAPARYPGPGVPQKAGRDRWLLTGSSRGELDTAFAEVDPAEPEMSGSSRWGFELSGSGQRGAA